jgi:hypothetical protein
MMMTSTSTALVIASSMASSITLPSAKMGRMVLLMGGESCLRSWKNGGVEKMTEKEMNFVISYPEVVSKKDATTRMVFRMVVMDVGSPWVCQIPGLAKVLEPSVVRWDCSKVASKANNPTTRQTRLVMLWERQLVVVLWDQSWVDSPEQSVLAFSVGHSAVISRRKRRTRVMVRMMTLTHLV